jgi:hypothetical protein
MKPSPPATLKVKMGNQGESKHARPPQCADDIIRWAHVQALKLNDMDPSNSVARIQN